MVSAFKMFVDGSCSTLLKTTASLLPELGPDTAKATTSHIFPEPVPVSRLTNPYLNTKTIVLPRPGRSDDVRLATLFDLRLGEGLFRRLWSSFSLYTRFQPSSISAYSTNVSLLASTTI